MPTDEELDHRAVKLALEVLEHIAPYPDQRRAATSLLRAARETGAEFVGLEKEGTVTMRLPGTAGPEAPPVVRLADPADHEMPALVAMQESQKLTERAETGPFYTVIPASATGLRPPDVDERELCDQASKAFGNVWRKVLSSRHPDVRQAKVVLEGGLDPRIVQSVVVSLAQSSQPPASLILTHARRPTDVPQPGVSLPGEPPWKSEYFPAFEMPQSTDGSPKIVVMPSSLPASKLRELPGYKHESEKPGLAPIVLPDGLPVDCVSSRGQTLVVLNRPVPVPRPRQGRRVVDATTRHQHGVPRPRSGPAGPSVT